MSSAEISTISSLISSIWVCLGTRKGGVPVGVHGEQLKAGGGAGIFGERQDWLGKCEGGGEHLIPSVARGGGGEVVEVKQFELVEFGMRRMG